MRGLMMDRPLLLTHFLERAEKLYPNREIATRTATGVRRTTYAQIAGRARRLASGLSELGVVAGERVGTFAWNHDRHLELYFAIPGSGRVLHTLNIRLFAEQIAFIANHAEDRVIFVDDVLVPLLEKVAPELRHVRAYVVMGDAPTTSTSLAPLISYEDLVSQGDTAYRFPTFDENEAAAMCYTSGTTGNPKGVLYSHRALYLQSMAHAMADGFALCERDCVLAIVPMFHANAWCMPYACTMVGAKQVYPGQYLQAADVAELLEKERVTLSGGVPTIWTSVLDHLDQKPRNISALTRVLCGGSAVPLGLIDRFDRRGIRLMQGWGMTETSPLVSLGRVKVGLEHLGRDDRLRVLAKQGLTVPCTELRIVGDDGNECPWDGKSAGEIEVRGPWVVREYYQDPRSPQSFHDGWFKTGDIAAVDAEGYIQIQDRAKDVIKTGGEWVSSVELENAIMGHPKVLEAAVIGVHHPKWEERPLACVVPREEFRDRLTKEEILDHLRPLFAKWWLPDDVVFIEAIPKTSVGKFSKKELRERFKDHPLA
ncbi:MAG: long-chain fatty acid--CoA ligase [Candidatus Binatia bacterium]